MRFLLGILQIVPHRTPKRDLQNACGIPTDLQFPHAYVVVSGTHGKSSCRLSFRALQFYHSAEGIGGKFLGGRAYHPFNACNITAETQQRHQVLFIEAKIDSSICSNEVVHPIHLPQLACYGPRPSKYIPYSGLCAHD